MKTMENIKRILIVIRLSQDNIAGLRHGVALAKLFHAELFALRIFSHPVNMAAVNVPGFSVGYANYLSVRDEYKEELDKAINKVVGDGFPIKEFVTDKDPLSEIMRTVKEEKIDLVVALAHEEGVLEHTMFGGENDALIRKLPCSVLLVKHEPRQA